MEISDKGIRMLRLDFFVNQSMKKFHIALLVLLAFVTAASAQPTDSLGIRLENYAYPFPVSYMRTTVQHLPVEIAYMDVQAAKPNGKAVILFHGKNFPAAYWKNTIIALNNAGYRVIAPDALGFGKSSKPVIQYSFSLLTYLDKILLDTLGIDKVSVVGHSMGGMVATRFVLSYPERVDCLVLEDAIGLEDWREKGVPFRQVDDWYKDEKSATYESILNYHKTSYYPVWEEKYREWVDLQYRVKKSMQFDQLAWVNALTYDMIYNQPVMHEFKDIQVPTLVVVGDQDKTKLARNAPKEVSDKLGHYKELGKETAAAIPNSQLIIYQGVGHVPHLQIPETYYKDLLQFLAKH